MLIVKHVILEAGITRSIRYRGELCSHVRRSDSSRGHRWHLSGGVATDSVQGVVNHHWILVLAMRGRGLVKVAHHVIAQLVVRSGWHRLLNLGLLLSVFGTTVLKPNLKVKTKNTLNLFVNDHCNISHRVFLGLFRFVFAWQIEMLSTNISDFVWMHLRTLRIQMRL